MNSSRGYTVDWLLLIMPGLGKWLNYKLSMVVGREENSATHRIVLGK